MPYLRISLTLLVLMLAPPLRADVVSSSDTHYVLRLEARADLPPAMLWKRLVNPAAWWSADHSYSGDAANLSLDVGAGGLWKESWGNNSVVHGRLLTAIEGQLLRLEAPFGPLQAKGAYVIWTISLKPDGEGTLVVFDEVAHAPAGSNMIELAPAVHGVKQAAIESLTRSIDSP
jgi:uncharacterized protein YndB with AHSA1/START domain